MSKQAQQTSGDKPTRAPAEHPRAANDEPQKGSAVLALISSQPPRVRRHVVQQQGAAASQHANSILQQQSGLVPR